MGYPTIILLCSLFIMVLSSQTVLEAHERLSKTFEHIDNMFAKSHVDFQELNDKTIFRNNGRLYSDLAYGHLIVKLDIRRALLDRKMLLNQLNDGLQAAVFPKGMAASHKYRLQWMQNYFQQHFLILLPKEMST